MDVGVLEESQEVIQPVVPMSCLSLGKWVISCIYVFIYERYISPFGFLDSLETFLLARDVLKGLARELRTSNVCEVLITFFCRYRIGTDGGICCD